MAHEDKKKQLFACLDAEEKKLKGSCLEQKQEEIINPNKRSHNRQDESIERYKKKQSIFKRPEMPISKCLKVRQRPDHERYPERYRHYTLSDVTDTSDGMNTSAAFSFLREMEERKRNEEQTSKDSEPEKIVFKNSVKLKPKEFDEVEQKERLQGHKFVMKEYVVGEKKQKPKREKSKKYEKSDSAKQLRLSHLNDVEEEDE